MDARARDHRLLGALVAVALALIVLAAGAAVLALGGWPGPILIFTGIVALIVGPLAGWRTGPAAVTDAPGWPDRGVVTLMAGHAIVNIAYVVVAVILVPANLGYAAYGMLWAAIYTVVLTFAVAVPLGAVWVRILRRLAGPPDHAVGA